MMVESDDRTDLTRLESAQDIAYKHYLDCALPLKYVKLPSPLLDIGTGAGFPGLVLKILSPETEVILGEVRPKRTRFLEQVIERLGLKGVQVFAHRIGPQFPHEIQGVVTRALESCRDTLYRVQPFLPAGGRVILLKGPRGDEEIAEAIKDVPDFRHEKTYSYHLGNTRHDRRLMIFVREKESLRTATGPGENPPQGRSATQAARAPIEITSRANPLFKSLIQLSEARGIRKAGQFLLSGEKLVNEVIADPKLSTNLEAIVADPQMPALKHSRKEIRLAPALFRELDELGTRYPIALMRLAELRSYDPAHDRAGITVFLPFQDPANVGAAIRSAAAFGAARVVLLKEAASPYLPKALRAAANAIFHVEILAGPTLSHLVQSGAEIYRLDMEGEVVSEVEFPPDVRFLAGVEGYGFRETGNTRPIRIPMAGNVESLNAQTALSIVLYELQRRRISGASR